MTNILYLCDKYYYMQKMSRVRFHSMEAVGNLANVTWWGPNWDGWENGSILNNLEKIDSKIDLIVVYKPLEMGNDWDKVKIPICMRYNETYDQPWTKEEIIKSNSSLVIFHHENDLYGNISDYKTMLPNVTFEYVPHSAEKTIFKDYQKILNLQKFEKTWDVLLVGALGYTSKIGQHYPIRDRMASILDKFPKQYKVGRYNRPPGRSDEAYKNGSAIEFAKVINSAKICITDSGAPKSRFGKYVEIPMCGTVIAGDIPNDDQENFKKFIIEINNDMTDSEIISKITSYLKDDNKLNKLKEEGLAWSSNYTQEKYAERFIKKVEKFI